METFTLQLRFYPAISSPVSQLHRACSRTVTVLVRDDLFNTKSSEHSSSKAFYMCVYINKTCTLHFLFITKCFAQNHRYIAPFMSARESFIIKFKDDKFYWRV